MDSKENDTTYIKRYNKYKKKYLKLKSQLSKRKYTIDKNLLKRAYVFKVKFPKMGQKMGRKMGRQESKEKIKKLDEEYYFISKKRIEIIMINLPTAISRIFFINEKALPKKSDLLINITKQKDLFKFMFETEMLSGNYSKINEMNPETGEIVITTPKGIYQLETLPLFFEYDMKDKVLFEWKFKKAFEKTMNERFIPKIVKKLLKLDDDILKYQELKELGLHDPATIFPKDPGNVIDIIMYMIIFKYFLDGKAYMSLGDPMQPENTIYLMVTDIQKRKDVPVKDIPLRTTIAREMV